MRTEWRLRTIPIALKNILDNPRVGRYVKKLHVGALHDDWAYRAHHVEEDDSIEAQKDFSEKCTTFAKAACQSDYLYGPGYTERNWESLIQDGDEEFPLALLLPVLPNLYTLSIKWYPGGEPWLGETVKRVPTAAMPMLSNLRTVFIESGADGYVDFEYLLLFSALPSLKSLSAREGWHDDLHRRHSPSSTPHSNATHLIMS
ncbi:MAG: hypothetical protein ALECFALPRED_000992 [Alectoria fallacina]|uniref:Uncharacterized protein n=1 Tax=Alectoria fallacina TaxID=1903189 RepID=A0A8H3JAF6_9LECA|nr:MAG: hypothetical protein ALECFALPRED_000992 [Alectoria fallacina]